MKPGSSNSEHTSRQRYEVRVNGLVPMRRLLEDLGEVEVAQHELRTVVTGSFTDQAALYGFLHRLRAYGLEVVEVHRVPTRRPATRGEQPSSEDDAGSGS